MSFIKWENKFNKSNLTLTPVHVRYTHPAVEDPGNVSDLGTFTRFPRAFSIQFWSYDLLTFTITQP